MRGKGLLATGLTVAALAASVGPAQGAVTIGSNLTPPTTMDNMPGCNFACTATNLSLPPANQAAGGLVSPVNGNVTSWRALANVTDGLRLRVLRQVNGTTYQGVSTSAEFNSAGMDTGQVAASLPIRIGDTIGLNSSNGRLIYGQTPGASVAAWFLAPTGPLADGATRAADTTANNLEALVQATIEPTNTLTFGTVTRNKKKGSAKVTMSVPNAGELIYSGNGLVISGPPKVAAAGDIKVGVKAFRRNREKLFRKGKLRVSFQVSFQPSFGSLRTTTEKLTLRKKLKK